MRPSPLLMSRVTRFSDRIRVMSGGERVGSSGHRARSELGARGLALQCMARVTELQGNICCNRSCIKFVSQMQTDCSIAATTSG